MITGKVQLGVRRCMRTLIERFSAFRRINSSYSCVLDADGCTRRWNNSEI
jgi:hypothetical protein